jgi:molybdate transport system substrate-binding protein
VAHRLAVRASAIALALLAVGCGDGRTRLTVFAASSLTEAFQDLEARFEAAHPQVDVQLTFAGSQALRLQIAEGAPADVFASADAAHLAALEEAGLVEAPEVFAENAPALVVPPGSPIQGFEDLPRAERIVIGDAAVPVGRYARAVLDRAEAALGRPWRDTVDAHVVSEERNVRHVRAKVELGEADAAIVYRTDALASDRLRAVAVPEAFLVRAAYPIAVVRGSRHRGWAVRFVAMVLGEEGRAVLGARGFIVDGGDRGGRE